ncbi:hypothetical protein Bcep18194_C7261 [Burkholderia lata]|uniref:Uncharacterized protein n=1 Tax=Burkholderia lata (strain ATCC 17760 / DSM 23089 / LMG 22485 / NCIMB 9086 / R18194 / 383) TaxID=482957 RepID=Q39ML1_BURL3|nr:hypothetical protein Bcep18194_C7261 [Burkholderia lata]
MRHSRPAPAVALKCRRDACGDTLEACSAISRAWVFSLRCLQCPVAQASAMSCAPEGVNLTIVMPFAPINHRRQAACCAGRIRGTCPGAAHAMMCHD